MQVPDILNTLFLIIQKFCGGPEYLDQLVRSDRNAVDVPEFRDKVFWAKRLMATKILVQVNEKKRKGLKVMMIQDQPQVEEITEKLRKWTVAITLMK